jgi:IclR family transcriptional regulator, acetate operon repressor
MQRDRPRLDDDNDRALELVTGQGFGQPKQYGPTAPTTVKALPGFVDAARARGYATIYEVFAPGMTAMAALGPALLAAANELSTARLASPIFGRMR